MTGDILDRAKPFLVECPICDYGIGKPCVCPEGDYRPVMLELVREIEWLRAGHPDPTLQHVSTCAPGRAEAPQPGLHGQLLGMLELDERLDDEGIQ